MIEARPSRHVVLKYSSSNSPPPALAAVGTSPAGAATTNTRTRKKRTSMDTQVLEDQAVIISTKRTTRSSRNNSIVPTEDEEYYIEEEHEEEDIPSDPSHETDMATPAVQTPPKPVGRPPKSRNTAGTSNSNNSTSTPGATRGRKPGLRRGRKPKDHTATPVSEKLDPFKNLHQHINNHYKEHLAAQDHLKTIFANSPETLADINLLYDLPLDAEPEWNQTVDKLTQVLIDMKDKWMMLDYKRRKLAADIQAQKNAAALKAKAEAEISEATEEEAGQKSVEAMELSEKDAEAVKPSDDEAVKPSDAEAIKPSDDGVIKAFDYEATKPSEDDTKAIQIPEDEVMKSPVEGAKAAEDNAAAVADQDLNPADPLDPKTKLITVDVQPASDNTTENVSIGNKDNTEQAAPDDNADADTDEPALKKRKL